MFLDLINNRDNIPSLYVHKLVDTHYKNIFSAVFNQFCLKFHIYILLQQRHVNEIVITVITRAGPLRSKPLALKWHGLNHSRK